MLTGRYAVVFSVAVRASTVTLQPRRVEADYSWRRRAADGQPAEGGRAVWLAGERVTGREPRAL